MLRIVRGAPDAEEVAALLAVLSAAAGGQSGDDGPATETSRWAEPERLLRRPVAPTGWWGAGLPG